MSVVGLPDDDGGEKDFAALVVPDYEYDIALSRSRTQTSALRKSFPRSFRRSAVPETH